VSVGVELGYAEITSNFAGTSTSLADVTGLSVTVSVGARPIIVRFQSNGVTESAGTFGGGVYLDQDGSSLGTMGIWVSQTTFAPAICERRLNPSAGSHTYKIRYKQGTAGTLTIVAGLGNAEGTNGPAFIQVVEV
jgi:hypothetical protein